MTVCYRTTGKCGSLSKEILHLQRQQIYQFVCPWNNEVLTKVISHRNQMVSTEESTKLSYSSIYISATGSFTKAIKKWLKDFGRSNSELFLWAFLDNHRVSRLFNLPTHIPTLKDVANSDFILRALDLVILPLVKDFSRWNRLFPISAPM